MKHSYVVKVHLPEDLGLSGWPYSSDYFPRQYYYLKDAKKSVQDAIKNGALAACIEYPNGRKEVLYI